MLVAKVRAESASRQSHARQRLSSGTSFRNATALLTRLLRPSFQDARPLVLSRPASAVTFPASRKWSGASPSSYIMALAVEHQSNETRPYPISRHTQLHYKHASIHVEHSARLEDATGWEDKTGSVEDRAGTEWNKIAFP